MVGPAGPQFYVGTMVSRLFVGHAQPFRGLLVGYDYVTPDRHVSGGWLAILAFEDGDEMHASDRELHEAHVSDPTSVVVGAETVALRARRLHPRSDWTEEAEPGAEAGPGVVMLTDRWGLLWRPVVIVRGFMGVQFVKCPVSGALAVLPSTALRPFSDVLVGAPVVGAALPRTVSPPLASRVSLWRCNQGTPAERVAADASPAISGGPLLPSRPGAHHDRIYAWSTCHACAQTVTPMMFPLLCRGSTCPVTRERFPLAGHPLYAFWCRDCLQHDPNIAHGERDDVLSVPRHADFAGTFRCPVCVASNLRGRPVALASAPDRTLTELARRAMLDQWHGSLEAASYSTYASMWRRVDIFEAESGLLVLQPSPSDPPVRPDNMALMLEWMYTKSVGRCGGAAKLGILDRTRSAIAHVADARGVPNPGASLVVRNAMKGIKKRIGVAVDRVEPFRLNLLLRLLVHVSAQPQTFQRSRLICAIIVSIFAFLRGHEATRLRWRHISIRAGDMPTILFRLLWCKQDVYQVGCDVVVCCVTKAGLDIAGHIRAYRAVYVTTFGAAHPDDLVFPSTRADGSRCMWPTSDYLSDLRAVLSEMQALNEPLLRGVSIMAFTLKSAKRGGSCEATDANSDINACLVHGWISRRSTHNLKNRCMAETYTDLENAEKHPARRYAVTFLMGTPRASLGFSG